MVKSLVKVITINVIEPSVNIPTFVGGGPGFRYSIEEGTIVELTFNLVEIDGDDFTIEVDLGTASEFTEFEANSQPGEGTLYFIL